MRDIVIIETVNVINVSNITRLFTKKRLKIKPVKNNKELIKGTKNKLLRSFEVQIGIYGNARIVIKYVSPRESISIHMIAPTN